MATWKKIITSGSAADLSSLTLDTALPVGQGGTGATTLTDGGILFGNGTGAIQASAVLADGQMLVGDGTTEPSIESGATLRTSIGVGTGDNVQFTNITGTGNTTLGNATSDTHTITGHITASGYTVSASKFIGDGSELTGVSQDIDTLSAGSAIIAADKFLYSDAGDEKSIAFGIITSSVFANIAGDVTIAAGGVSSIGNDKVTFAKVQNIATSRILGRTTGGSGDIEELTPATVFGTFNSDLGGNFTIGNQSSDTATFTGGVTIGGDLTVNGSTTTIDTAQLTVSESLIFLATGSAALNVDAGLLVQSSSIEGTGSAFYHDTTQERWSVSKTVSIADFSIDPLQFVTTVKTEDVNPSSTSGSYGAGEMHVNTASGDIWIRYE